MALFNSFSCRTPIFEKYFFYLFSCYLIIRGAGTLFWAVILHLNIFHYFPNVVTLKKDSLAWVDILIGVCVCIIIFSFICGIYSVIFFDNSKIRNQCTNVTCMTTTFALVFLALLIVQTAVAVNMINLRSTTITDFKEAVWNYGRGGDTEFVDNIQREFYCCGIYSFRDYINLHLPIPKSCCHSITCSIQYNYGCEIEIFIRLYAIYAIGVFTMFFSVVEFVGFFWTLYLANSIRKRNAVKRQEMHFQQGLQFQQRNNAGRF